jgi:hypothetical protein
MHPMVRSWARIDLRHPPNQDGQDFGQSLEHGMRVCPSAATHLQQFERTWVGTLSVIARERESDRYAHPAANRFKKHPKSSTFSTGGTVDPSQLAYVSPAANLFRKHPKSSTLSNGAVVEPSQLA